MSSFQGVWRGTLKGVLISEGMEGDIRRCPYFRGCGGGHQKVSSFQGVWRGTLEGVLISEGMEGGIRKCPHFRGCGGGH